MGLGRIFGGVPRFELIFDGFGLGFDGFSCGFGWVLA